MDPTTEAGIWMDLVGYDSTVKTSDSAKETRTLPTCDLMGFQLVKIPLVHESVGLLCLLACVGPTWSQHEFWFHNWKWDQLGWNIKNPYLTRETSDWMGFDWWCPIDVLPRIFDYLRAFSAWPKHWSTLAGTFSPCNICAKLNLDSGHTGRAARRHGGYPPVSSNLTGEIPSKWRFKWKYQP